MRTHLFKKGPLLVLAMMMAVMLPDGLQGQGYTKPSSCVNLDFSKGNFDGWVGRTRVYPKGTPDANNCNQNQRVFTQCPGQSGNSCNGCYSGCLQPGNCPSPGNPMGVPVPAANTACPNPPLTAGTIGINYYDNPGIFPGRHTIITQSVPDPLACNNIMTLPAGEPFAARLGNGQINSLGTTPPNTGVGWEIDHLYYTFRVADDNNLLTYKYAIILQDPLRDPQNPPHTDSIRPRFNVYIRDAATKQVINPTCGKFEVKYDTNIAGFRNCTPQQINNLGGNMFRQVGTAYRAWTTVGVDLRAYKGKDVTLEFVTYDCGWGGHFGYAYVTARCDSFALFVEGCKPDGSVTVSAPPGFSYSWLPGGETTRSINVKNVKPGDSVKVILTTANGCTTDLTTTIYPTTTKAKFNVSPLVACVQNNVFGCTDSSYSFYTGNNANVPIVKWEWNFGDGYRTTDRHPSHSYTAPGTYTISLVVTNAQNCVDSIQKVVVVLPPPVASFSTQDVCVGSTVLFQDLSTTPAGIINQWSWTFGDGTPAEVYTTRTNPSHVYTAPGTYTIKLNVATDVGCVDDTSRTVKVWPNPKPNFTSDTTCVGDSTIFRDLSLPGDPADPITTWIWSFGDNSPFNGARHPLHLYPAAQTYTVKLSVTTQRGCVKDTILTALVNPPPQPSFTFAPVCFGAPVNFADKSTTGPGSTIATWNWNFGDPNSPGNNTSTLQNPTHFYSAPGTYTVSLGIVNDKGCADSIQDVVSVLPPPVASFSGQSVCPGSPIVFQDLSTIPSGFANYQWSWSFGDGTTAVFPTSTNPSHTYTATGTYNVRLLIVSDAGCADDTTLSVTVWPKPIPLFSVDTVCVGDSTAFRNLSAPGDPADPLKSWLWSFGDGSPMSGAQHPGHLYTTAQTYTVKLTVTTQRGCISDTSLSVLVNPLPVAAFTASAPCLGVPVTFSGQQGTGSGTIANWNWNFGDPNASPQNNTSALQNPSHSYSAPGNYVVFLKVTSQKGCVDSIQQPITVYPIPKASFSTQDVCAGNTMTFKDLSTAPGTSPLDQWTWDFGDGSQNVFPSTSNPAHTYTATGTYNVRLQVRTSVGCIDDTVIAVKVWPKPRPLFTADTVCLGDSTAFRDLSLPGDPADPVQSWIWIFGDNSPLSGSQHPQHVYAGAQTYNVKLIVSTQRGCVDDTSFNVLINPLPTADFSATPFCFGVPVNFTDNSTPAANISRWDWNFGDPNANPQNNISTLQNPTHIYSKVGSHDVKLIVTTPAGCKDTVIKPVIIPPLPEPDFDANRYEGCVPLCVEFFDLTFSPQDSVVDWKWTYGDGYSGVGKRPPHCYQDTGKFTVSFTITTANGCKLEKTWIDMIWVHPYPKADFTATPASTTESAPTVVINDKAWGAVNWLYELGDGSISSDQNPVHDYPKAGKYTIWQYVVNQWGCRDSISRVIVVTPEWSFYIPNAFSPNGDGKNEGFIGKSWNLIEHQMWIFDRWGNQIYTTGQTKSTDDAVPWDGKANGGKDEAQEDVYVWLVKFKDIHGKSHKLIGHVTLVK